MPEGNSLVADAPQDGDGPGPLTSGNGDYGYAGGIGIAESAIDTFNGIKDGNWVEGGLGVLGLAAEGAAAAIDPFGWLMSSVASFLMEHIQPLKDMLDSVCGDPPVIQSYSETWSNVATHLDETKVSFANAVANGTTGWTGAAADSYRESCKEQEETIAGAASVAGSISTVVMIFGEVVSFVRETVRDLIADLVGKLISWVLETVFSLGFGTPVVVAQAVTAISKWGTKIAELLKKLLETIRKVSPLLGKLGDILAKILKVSGKIAGKVTGLDVISTKNITPGGFLQRGGPDVDTPGGGGSSGGGSGSDGGDSGNTSDGSGGDPGDSGSSSDGDSSSSDGSSPEGDGSDRATATDAPPASTRNGSGGDSSSTGNGTNGTGDSGSPDTGDSPSGGGDSPSSSGNPATTNTPSSNYQSTTNSPSSTSNSPSNGSPGGADSPSSGYQSPANSPSSTMDSPSSSGNPGPANSPTSNGGPGTDAPSLGSPGRTDAPTSSGGGGDSPSTTTNTPPAGNGSPHPAHPDGGGAPPSSPSPSHSSPSPAPHGGGDSPSGSPSSPGTHTGGPAPHSGSGGPSPSTHHDSGTSTSASAQPSSTMPRTPDAGPSAVPSQRGPDGGGSSPSGQQGTPMAGGPAGGPGAPGGGSPGAGSPGGRPGASGGWTGTPGSPGAPTPRTPDAPAARPNTAAPNTPAPNTPSPNTPPQAAPRGFGPGPNSPAPSHHGATPPGHQPPHGGPSHPDGQPGQHTPDGNGNHSQNGHHDPGDPGTPPHHDPEKLGPDEVNQRHAESTPAGTSFHRDDPEMGDLPHRVQPDPDGRYTADVHVTPDGHARIGNQLYTPEEFADILRRNGDYDGRPIRLIGCDAGSNDFAQRLSRELDTEVLAPNKPAWTDSDGRVFSSDYEVGPDGQVRPRIPPNGEWSVHSPDGSTSRGSDDAFTPDTADADKDDIDVDSAQSRGKDYSRLDEEWGDYQVHSEDPDFYRPGHAEHAPIVDYDRPGRHDPDAGPDSDPPNPYNDPPRSPHKTIETEMPEKNSFPPKNEVIAPDDPYRIPPALRDQQGLLDENGKLPKNTAIPVEYKGANGEVAARTTFYTDANGDIKWVELTPGRQYDSDADWKDIKKLPKDDQEAIKAGTNPDFNHMLPECKYEVDNWRDPEKKFYFETNDRAQTEGMSGQPVYGPSNDNYRDPAAQSRAGDEGRDAYKKEGVPDSQLTPDEREYRKVRWAGGHLAPTEGGGPGGYGNMHGQLAASNSGNARDGFDQLGRGESWRQQEEQIARYAQATGEDVEIERLEVETPRRAEDGLAEREVMRWRVKDIDPETGEPRVRVFERAFINTPEGLKDAKDVDWSKVKHYAPPKQRQQD
ncbi:hypothetical protein [Prauserella flavalba]|uniref:hypothetical protein n=1 Tax=Prauserella flavalba TaxID=1477506 RepID=UPI0036EAEEF3